MTEIQEQRLARFAQVGLRLALGTAFLSAVAGRFGIWHMFGHAGGGWDGFIKYTAEVNWYLPKTLIPATAIAATTCETAFGLCLVFGIKVRWAAFGSAVLLMLFALAMASGDPKSPFDYSVFSASLGALTLASITPASKKGEQPAF